MRFVNLTRYPMTFELPDGRQVWIGASGRQVHVDVIERELELVGGMPAVARQHGEITNLPAPVPGVVYLVTGLVLERLEALGRYRADIYAGDVGRAAKRDARGKIMAVQRLIGMLPGAPSGAPVADPTEAGAAGQASPRSPCPERPLGERRGKG